MSILFINTGTAPNAGNGDTLRTAFNKINQNFLQLYYGGEVVQSDQPPSVVSSSTLWYDTISGRTYVYYNGAWIDASPANEAANATFLTSATIKDYAGYIQSVSLFDSLTGTYTNTVNNITKLNFDTESAFSVTDQGSGAVLIGMNSTFKYIDIAGQPSLTAIGLDTLTFVAGTGTQFFTDATPGQQKIKIAVQNAVPSTTTSGLLYNDGLNNLSWTTPRSNVLTSGAATFSLTTAGNVVFNDGSVQTSAYIPPVTNSDNSTQPIVFVSTTGTLQSAASVGMNPQMGQVTLNSVVIGSNITTGPVIGTLQLTRAGTNYALTATSTSTLGGTGVGLTVSWANTSSPTSVNIANPGTGYAVGDVIWITGGYTQINGAGRRINNIATDYLGSTATGQTAGGTVISVGNTATMQAYVNVNSGTGGIYQLRTPIQLTYADNSTQVFDTVGLSDTSSFYLNFLASAGYFFPINLKTTNFVQGSTTATFQITSVNAPGLQGYATWPDGTRQTTAYTGTVQFSNIIGTPNFVLTSALTTTNISTFVNNSNYVTLSGLTTTNVSTFVNNSGYLTSATVNQYVATTNAAGNFVLNGGLIINNTTTATMILTGTVNGGLISSALRSKPISVTTFNTSTLYTWQFNTDGSITWPDGSVQASATTATLAASSLTNKIFNGTWTFSVSSSGTVQYPDGSIQKTAYTGTTFTGLANYATTSSYAYNAGYATTAGIALSLLTSGGTSGLRIVAPPATLVGKTGDLAGDIAYDSNNLYVCTQNYVQTNFNAVAATTQTNVLFIDILQAGVPVPQAGWQIRDPIGGPTMTITNVSSILVGANNTPVWRLSENTFANSYYPGLTYVLINPAGTTSVWGKVGLSLAANTATAVTKLSNFVTLDAPVSLGNVYALWHGPGNILKIGGVNSSFVGSYNLQAYYNNVPVGSQGTNVTFSTTGTTVGGQSLTGADRADLILTIPSTGNAYRIIGITGASFNDNFISIEQLA